jgi:hypothetical protein
MMPVLLERGRQALSTAPSLGRYCTVNNSRHGLKGYDHFHASYHRRELMGAVLCKTLEM